MSGKGVSLQVRTSDLQAKGPPWVGLWALDMLSSDTDGIRSPVTAQKTTIHQVTTML